MNFKILPNKDCELRIKKILDSCCPGETIQFLYFESPYVNANRRVFRLALSISPLTKKTTRLQARSVIGQLMEYAEKTLGKPYYNEHVWCSKVDGFLV